MDKRVLEFTSDQIKKDLPKLAPGQVVRIHQKVKEGDKERIQVFEGTVIAIKGDSPTNRTLHVRKISGGVGVERIFPINSPLITEIDVIKSGKVRRAKLYYIREKERKIKEDEKKQERIDKQKNELAERRKKEAELKAEREAIKKQADEEAEKKTATEKNTDKDKSETVTNEPEKKPEEQNKNLTPENKKEKKEPLKK